MISKAPGRIAVVGAGPGGLTLEDFAAYRVVERPAVCGPYRAYRVCGMGPSAALTTKIAPSICAAPVIMFFT